MTSDEPKLSPCPFCGLRATLTKSPLNSSPMIICSNVSCSVRPQVSNVRNTDILNKMWNERTDTDDTCRLRSGLKIDVHILLDAYFHLNEGLVYDPDMDMTICEIAEEWKYVCDDKDGKLVPYVNPHNEDVS